MSYFSYHILDCGITVNDADHFWKCKHAYNRQRIYYVLDGEAYFFNNGIDYPVRTGDICLFPSNLEFIMKQYTEKMMRLIYFDFETVPPIFSDKIYSIKATRDPAALHILGSMEHIFREISELHPDWSRVYYPQNETDSLSRMICLLFDALLTRLSEDFGIEYHMDPVIRNSVEYINEHFTEEIHISDLAENVHLCADHYTRLFRANMRSTPYQYITGLRLNRALALREQGINGDELLRLTGFRNLDSLSRAIRREKSRHDAEK